MKRSDLAFDYPAELVAIQPQRPSRVAYVDQGPYEITLDELMEKPAAGDIWIINETRVLRRRVFSGTTEILFLKQLSRLEWEVLFPSRDFRIGESLELPEGLKMTLKAKGRPQVVELSQEVSENYFFSHGEVPLPPYIQKARGERHNRLEDESWYQTFWAQKPGSLAAPTASLHFEPQHFSRLRERGVLIHQLTLHVGLGTFLPVTAEDLDDHQMHGEVTEIPIETWKALQEAKTKGRKVWCLGTTCARSLESAASGLLEQTERGFVGETKLFIQPGFRWQVVDVLMTNFHQPESTLLALVASFRSLEEVKSVYSWAIARKMRLFSYGDLSVWNR